MGVSSNLTLDSRNNGLIQFDDKVTVQSEIDEYLTNAIANGSTVTEDGEGGYFVEGNNGGGPVRPVSLFVSSGDTGDIVHVIKTDKGFLVPVDSYNYSADELESNLAYYRDEGYDIQQNGETYIITKDDEYVEIIKQGDGSYTEVRSEFYSEYGGNMVITGDSSSRVEFNNELKGFATYDISGTNVDVNEGVGTIYRTVTHDGGVLNINTGATAEDSVVNDKGTLHVASGGLAENTTVNSGGTLPIMKPK